MALAPRVSPEEAERFDAADEDEVEGRDEGATGATDDDDDDDGTGATEVELDDDAEATDVELDAGTAEIIDDPLNLDVIPPG